MAESANFSPGASSGKKVSVQHTSVNIRGSKKAEQKDSRRRISCKDLGNGECEGWMWSKKEKSGFGPNSWRNYWFMLKDKSLYCYKDPRDVVARRLYHLPGFVVFVARETSRKYAFKISHASFGTVLFATKDDKDMAKWMTHINSSCEDKCKRKKSDESTGDISESDNEEDNTEEEEKKSLPPVAERDDETEDRDSTWTAPTTVRLSAAAAAASSSSAASETEPTHFASSGPELHLLTFCNPESQPVRSSIPESTSSSSKEESTPLAVADQEPSQLLHRQSNSVHLASPEPELKKHTSEALEPAVAAKKAPGPATPTKPKPSPKSSPSGESSASPTLQRPPLTRPTCAPATLAKPARTAPCTGGQSSTSATGSAPVALALSGHQAASSSKLLPSVTGAASAWPLRTDDVAEGSAKIPFETSNKNMNTGPETCAKQSSTDTDMTAPGYDTAVASVPSLPGRLINGPAFSATPSAAAASFTLACSAAECSATELAASTTNTKNVGPSTFAKPSALLRAVSETIPPNWNVSDHTLSSMPTASAARSSASAMSSSNVNNTSPCSKAHFCIVKQHSVQKEEARLSDVTSLSDTFQSAEALPEFSATKRAHITMTNIAKSMKIKAKPSPANHYQGLCSHLVMLQRSFKDKTQELQTLEELLKTPEMSSDRLKQFCHENRDFAKRLTGSSIVLGESFESDTENRLEDV